MLIWKINYLESSRGLKRTYSYFFDASGESRNVVDEVLAVVLGDTSEMQPGFLFGEEVNVGNLFAAHMQGVVHGKDGLAFFVVVGKVQTGVKK